MKWKVDNVLDNKWWQEVAILLFSFSLFSLKNDWILFNSAIAVWSGIGYYLMLYLHAQTNRFFLLPILVKQHKGFLYLVLTILLALLFSVVVYEISSVWITKASSLYEFSHQKSYQYQLATVIGTLICILGPVMFLKFYREEKRKREEALLLNQMQLNSLKSQLNPHFLFNTFNTLYGISLEFPERTPDLIMKVSQLMRYQLESNAKQCVSLEEELSFINSYIQLEKERVGYRCEITYDSKIDNENAYKISPMLLIAFVENAFKHGTCAIENCYVHISITVEKGKLHLQIVNSIPEKKINVVSTRIGIQNTTERLKIIYGSDYTLDIKNTDTVYTVNLALPLKKVGES
ncbi:histidine kinase [Flavobacterium endophyticum]|uniref:Histidine kinase n=1 Tax=Flavobacterium endophyticum TaxID=1540163 RepID=A0A495MEL1_9FLAO|nr:MULTISPECIES: histidine kinase [Flavobacterium]RKS23183.1 histidine kinase [Flavobacterium endophyticum]WDO11859.1 histidine kinase [Flavobacterium sp. WW92]